MSLLKPNYYISSWLCMLLAVLNLPAQDYKRVDIDVLGEPLDLITLDDRQSHLVTTNGLYNVSNLEPTPVASFHENKILRSNQKYSSSDFSHYYPILHGGYLCLEKKTSVLKIETGDLESGIIFQTRNGSKWLINNFLYKYKNKKWLFSKDLEIFSKFKDVQVYRDKTYLANDGAGVLIFDDNMEMTQITEKQGLMSNECNTLFVKSGYEYYVGHRGGLSFSSDNKIKQIDLSSQIGNLPILELEMDRAENLWGLTSNKVFKYHDGECTVLDIQLKTGEVFIALDVSHNQDIWILSDRALYVFPNTNIAPIVLDQETHSGNPIDLYKIRDRVYYSDEKQVYSYNGKENTWENATKKKAPTEVIIDENGHTNLIFSNNKGFRLNKVDARKMNVINIPENEIINTISRIGYQKYYSTQNSIFQVSRQNYKLLSHKEDSYYKVIKNDSGIYAFAENGIYKFKEDQLEPLLASYSNHKYPEFYNQIGIGNKLLTMSNHSLHLIDTESESLEVLDLNPLKVLDLKGNGILVWVLCSKSILALNKTKLFDGKIEIVKTIPIYDNFEKAKLSKFSKDALWISTHDKILRINIDQPTYKYAPNFKVHSIVNASGKQLFLDKKNRLSVKEADMPIDITYTGANFWTDNIRYAYHINVNGKNISEWKSDNTYSLSSNQTGRHTINAKFKDDIYGLNIDAPTIMIDIETSPVVEAGHSKFLILPILLISLIIMVLIKGISKIR